MFTNLEVNLNETASNSVKLGESESNIDSTAACIFCIHLCKTLRSSGEVQLRVGCAADWLASARPGWLRRGLTTFGSPGKVAHGWHLTSHTKNASYNLGISRELRGLGQLNRYQLQLSSLPWHSDEAWKDRRVVAGPQKHCVPGMGWDVVGSWWITQGSILCKTLFKKRFQKQLRSNIFSDSVTQRF